MKDKAMEQRILRALRRTWEVIAHDIFQARVECGEKNPYNVRRCEVVEVVLDADHARTYGEDNEAMELLYKMPYEAMKRLAAKAFSKVEGM
jgi:hypothetical protein